ncbi:MAG: hypothetical protein OXH36_02970 [Bdellovibrionales bacterium]|nr:hypothetical protein [Bdellovibrionales bacterium]
MKNTTYIVLSFFIILTVPVFSIEISNDMFIDSDSDIETDDNDIVEELSEEPHIERVRIIKKEVIMRASKLDKAVQSIDREQQLEPDHVVLDRNSKRETRNPAGSEKASKSIDYGDYELHWHKKE